MKIFADDLGFPEAPVLLPDGSFLFVEMAPEKGWVTRISADGEVLRPLDEEELRSVARELRDEGV